MKVVHRVTHGAAGVLDCSVIFYGHQTQLQINQENMNAIGKWDEVPVPLFRLFHQHNDGARPHVEGLRTHFSIF